MNEERLTPVKIVALFSHRKLELMLDCVMLVKPFKKLWNHTKLNLMERHTKVPKHVCLHVYMFLLPV